MKKAVFFLMSIMATAMLTTSCEKENEVKPAPVMETPKTEVPDAFIGKWQIGKFDMTGFWNYNGDRKSNQGTDAVAYTIAKDGSAEQFIYFDFTDGTNRQVLSYRKGTVSYDATNKSWKFNGAEGNFRAFVNGKKTQGNYESADLYPAYAPQYRSCSLETENQKIYMVCTNDRNEQLVFAKKE